MFYSFLAKRTLITLSDGTTMAVDELVKDDKVLTYNYSAKNHDGAHLENNELRVGNITNLIKQSIPKKDTVKVTLSNGNEIVVTKDFPLIGAGKATGWQVYDAFSYVKSHKNIEVTSIKELEDIIRPDVAEINEMHAGIHPEATEWYSSGQPPNERADTTKPGSMHPSGRQSGNFPGRLGVGKELYSWPIKVSEYEHITALEEQTGEELIEMYCINKVMIGHTIFANGFLVSACDWGYVWPDEFYINEGNYYPRGEGQ